MTLTPLRSTPPPSSGSPGLSADPRARVTACGCTSTSGQTLPANVQQRIATHPCYSESAHHHYARLHVAVAPACNIQCNYCNRKFDCANESRPGVVSELLTPAEAAHKVLVIAGKIPQLTVVGIAGPGDPLANPKHTFETFARIAEQAPDIKLCLSTNGLMLPEHIDTIKALNIDHVTLTINMVDPEIGAKIYPWIRWQRKRITGVEASRILHERQMQSLDLLREADILCKVNSVMIPGINDTHLPEVNRVIQAKGAFLHNIMPLISAPEHGTYFGLNGQRGPTPKELKALQDQCSGNMKMMRHCRQCRADAVGLLGEDRSQEFTKDRFLQMTPEYDPEQRRRVQVGIAQLQAQQQATKDSLTTAVPSNSPAILVAVASKGGGLVNRHFGHAQEFLIYEVNAHGAQFVGHRKIPQYCHGGSGEDNNLDQILEVIRDCKAVLVSKIGDCPMKRIREAGLEVVEDYDVIETVALKFYQTWLVNQAIELRPAKATEHNPLQS